MQLSLRQICRPYPILPAQLASDIQQFSESSFARQYFSTHRTGFLFRRRVPVAQMMVWQKVRLSRLSSYLVVNVLMIQGPLTSPLLTMNRALGKDAVKMFKVIQHIMGDRERERGPGLRLPPDNSLVAHNSSTSSLPRATADLLEEERYLLNEGLKHGDLRDEIYCQVMKQLSGNQNS